MELAGQEPEGPAKVTMMTETFFSQYLSGNHDVPFESIFRAFRANLAVPAPRLPPRNAATVVPVFSDKTPLLPKSVSIISRTVGISKSRRQGTVHVLWKLVSTGFCTQEWELERLWKAKGPKDVGDGRFLEVAIWAGQTETEIFEKSQEDLSEYNSLLLNLVMGVLRQKDWRGKTVPQSHVTNSATQTQDSFTQQRQRSTDEILNANKPQHLTKPFLLRLDVLREHNRVLEWKARRRLHLQLRHSFTQTTANLRDGFKSMESESSAVFCWLDLAPAPIRFFPMLWASTQTDQGEISATKKIAADGELILQTCPSLSTKKMDTLLVYFIQLWNEFGRRLPDGKAPSKETALGLRVSRFIQMLLKTRTLEFSRCPIHQGGPAVEAGCQFCEAAIQAPPPWTGVMVLLQCEFFTGFPINRNATEKVHQQFLKQRGLEREDSFLGELPSWYLLLHLFRQLLLDCGVGLPGSAQTIDCACFVSTILGKLMLEWSVNFGILQHWGIISHQVLGSREHPAHMCLRCGKLESESMGMFRVCTWCRRQRLLAKAHYCSLDCLLKDWHNHHKLHDALAPGKIPCRGSTTKMLSFS